MKLGLLVKVLACLALTAGYANAQDVEGTAASVDDMKKTESADGWAYTLKFSGTGGYAQHEKHLTETNGKTYSLGGKLDGSATWTQGSKQWRTSLLVDEGFQDNPNLSNSTKTSDLFKVETIYLWALEGMPNLGPYAKATFDTSIFKNDKLFKDPVTLTGAVAGTGVNRLRLTDGLGDNPMTLRGSVGVFYKAVSEEDVSLVLSGGLGAMRVWANGFGLAEVDATNYTVNNLQDFTDYGLVLGLDLRGKFDAKTSYQVGFESLTPFDKNEDDFPQLDDTDLIGATNYDAFAKIDTKIYDFLSLGYEFRIKKQPKLQKNEQLSNLFNLSLTYILL